MRRLIVIGLLGFAALALAGSSALAADAFKIAWEPVKPSRMQWFVATQVATGRVLQPLKCAWCVSDPWAKLKPDAALAARAAWAQAIAQAAYDRLTFAESPAGIKAAKLAEAQAQAESAKAAAARIAEIQKLYPLEKLPTVTVTAAVAVEK